MAEITQKNRISLSVIVAGLVMILLFVGLAIFLIVQRGTIPTVDEQAAQVRLKNLADLNAENQKVLNQYRWVDKNKGVVGIPINRAMDLIVAQLQTIKPHPAGPINPPAPAPAVSGALSSGFSKRPIDGGSAMIIGSSEFAGEAFLSTAGDSRPRCRIALREILRPKRR